MQTLWIGDFRTRQIQQGNFNGEDETTEYEYLIDDYAEYTWFNDNAVAQLPLFAFNNGNVVIMLGFNDCVYSCTWKTYNIDKLAENYSKTITELIEQYPGFTFYVCSVNPIDADYPFSSYSDTGIIPKDILNEKIRQFNQKIKASCKATFIDSYNYFTSTSFDTRDGVYYTKDSCKAFYNFIVYQLATISIGVSSLGRTRTTKDDAPKPSDDSWIYWTRDYNACMEIKDGVVLPNCTGYAWGRFMEILGDTPKLSTADAGTWWFNTRDGYTRGQTPKVGAVACWSKLNQAGHVAIVESIDEKTGSIITSESGYRNAEYDPNNHFWVSTRTNSDGAWGLASDGYVFQGFIYNPITIAGGTLETVSKADVVSANTYLTQAEMEINARYIWNYLSGEGWTLNAVAGILGNMQHESTISPGRWEGGKGPGFGLVQWTPATNLTNWCDQNGLEYTDIESQLKRIIWEKDNGVQYYKKHYKYTFKEFATSTDDPYTLACAFAFDYERSAVVLYGTAAEKEALRKKRGEAAENWYRYLFAYAPNSTFESKFVVDNFKIDQVTPTKITASFIVSNGESGQYTITNSSKKELVTKELNVSSEAEVVKTVSFKYNNLKPNTTYTLSIEVVSALGGDSREYKIDFKTPQSFPGSVTNLKIEPKLSNNNIKLIYSAPADWGYWKNNAHGYEIHLIVNGKSVAKKIINSLSNNSELILDRYFENYKSQVADNIQIGIRTWTEDNLGTKIFDNDYIKTSNSLCLLNKPFKAYLKTG